MFFITITGGATEVETGKDQTKDLFPKFSFQHERKVVVEIKEMRTSI